MTENLNETSATEEVSEATEAPESSVKALEEEGDIAADYLEELLDIFDLDGDIDIDVRQGRVDELTRIVNKLIAKVKDTGEAVPMKPMSSYERKIVHDVISTAGLVSESEGEGRDRHIVIKPA
jgi:spoIIIJ-associated protein